VQLSKSQLGLPAWDEPPRNVHLGAELIEKYQVKMNEDS
jgi:hypothetical protein